MPWVGLQPITSNMRWLCMPQTGQQLWLVTFFFRTPVMTGIRLALVKGPNRVCLTSLTRFSSYLEFRTIDKSPSIQGFWMLYSIIRCHYILQILQILRKLSRLLSLGRAFLLTHIIRFPASNHNYFIQCLQPVLLTASDNGIKELLQANWCNSHQAYSAAEAVNAGTAVAYAS